MRHAKYIVIAACTILVLGAGIFASKGRSRIASIKNFGSGLMRKAPRKSNTDEADALKNARSKKTTAAKQQAKDAEKRIKNTQKNPAKPLSVVITRPTRQIPPAPVTTTPAPTQTPPPVATPPAPTQTPSRTPKSQGLLTGVTREVYLKANPSKRDTQAAPAVNLKGSAPQLPAEMPAGRPTRPTRPLPAIPVSTPPQEMPEGRPAQPLRKPRPMHSVPSAPTQTTFSPASTATSRRMSAAAPLAPIDPSKELARSSSITQLSPTPAPPAPARVNKPVLTHTETPRGFINLAPKGPLVPLDTFAQNLQPEQRAAAARAGYKTVEKAGRKKAFRAGESRGPAPQLPAEMPAGRPTRPTRPLPAIPVSTSPQEMP